ncbi:MAG: hypothetical protein AAB674_01025 [Patescibacteria group bacterium]
MEFKNWLIKNASISGGIILFLAIILLFLGNDISGRVQGIREKNSAMTARLYAMESLASLKTDAEKATNLRGTLESFLPAKDQIIKFSKALENFAKNRKMDFGFAFESEISGTENSPGMNNFTMTSGGSYSDFIELMKFMERGKYVIGINYSELKEKGDKYEILIKGKIFSQ